MIGDEVVPHSDVGNTDELQLCLICVFSLSLCYLCLLRLCRASYSTLRGWQQTLQQPVDIWEACVRKRCRLYLWQLWPSELGALPPSLQHRLRAGSALGARHRAGTCIGGYASWLQATP